MPRPFRMTTIALLATAALPAQREPRAIAGRVLDIDDKAVVGAEVYLRWRVHPELPWLVGFTLGDGGLAERKFLTDGRGRFKIRPPNHGPFLMVAKHRGTSSTQVFPVLGGDYHILHLEPDHVMAGTVLGVANEPVSGATVRIVVTDNLQRTRLGLYRQPERRAETKTNAAGHFRLHFEHGYLRDPRWNVLMAIQAEFGTLMTGPLIHQRPTNLSKKLTLRLGGKRSFKIIVADQTTGKRIAGAMIIDPLASGIRGTTDEKGFCKLSPARGDELFVLKPGYEPLRIRPAARIPYALSASLKPGLGLTARLVGPSGPLTGARLLFASPRRNQCPIEWTSTVGEDGKVAVRSIPTGLMVLGFVEIEGRFARFYDGVMTKDLTLPKIRLRPERHIRGRVLAANKMPIAGARVALQSLDSNPANPRRVTYTDRAGRFRFDSVDRSDHAVIAAKGEHGQQAFTVRKTAMEEPITITLKPDQFISGRVVRPDGTPAAGAWVTIYRSAAGAFISGPRAGSTCLGVMADKEGRFRFGVRNKTSWTLTAATLHEGSHRNVTSTASAGASKITLKLTVQNR